MTEVTNAKELALLLAGIEIGREFKLYHEGDGIGGMHFESRCGKYAAYLWHRPGLMVVDFAEDDGNSVPHFALRQIYYSAADTAGELWRRWENAKVEAEAVKEEGGKADD